MRADTDNTPCRFDEGEETGEEDGTKRKKEFSDLFKKQMSLRKVNHNHPHTQTTRETAPCHPCVVVFPHVFATCWQLEGMGGMRPMGWRIAVKLSHMFGGIFTK